MNLFVFGARFRDPSHHRKIFAFKAGALNCGCKVASSTRLLLFTRSRLPSPRLHSEAPSSKRHLKKKEREADSEAFYDFIG